jgi:predicted nucleotidyltransferase
MLGQFKVLKDVANRLNQAGLAYMITGSLAMNYYAQPRMTRDVDLVVDLHTRDADRLVKLFTEKYYISPEAVAAAIANRSMFNLIHLEETMKVDMIVRKDTPYRRLEFDRRRTVDLEGSALQIVSPEDLVLSKLDWLKDSRSEMQLRDVRNLLASVLEIDEVYLGEWAGKLGLAELLRDARS